MNVSQQTLPRARAFTLMEVILAVAASGMVLLSIHSDSNITVHRH